MLQTMQPRRQLSTARASAWSIYTGPCRYCLAEAWTTFCVCLCSFYTFFTDQFNCVSVMCRPGLRALDKIIYFLMFTVESLNNGLTFCPVSRMGEKLLTNLYYHCRVCLLWRTWKLFLEIKRAYFVWLLVIKNCINLRLNWTDCLYKWWRNVLILFNNVRLLWFSYLWPISSSPTIYTLYT